MSSEGSDDSRSDVTQVHPSVTPLNWIRLVKYLKHYWGQMVLATIALLISMGCGLCFPLVIMRLLESVSHANRASSLNHSALLLAAALLAQAVFSFLQSYLVASVGEHIAYDLRTHLYRHIQSLSLDFFARHHVGELVSRLTNDVTQMRTMLTSTVTSSLSQLASLLGGVGIVFFISPRLAIFSFIVIPVVILVAASAGSRIEKSGTEIQDYLAASTTVAEETLQGIRVVKGFGREHYETRRYAVASQAVLGASIRQALYTSTFAALILLLGLGSIGAITWYGAREVIAGRISLPMIAGFLMYGAMIATSLAGLAMSYGQLRSAMGSVERVFQILDMRPSVQDSPQVLTIPPLRGRITLDDVSFGYEKNLPVLHRIRLDIQVGEIMALVGPSGSGKSTLFNLIPRFYDPSSGSIQIDGMDVRTMTQSGLRAQMAIVPQDTTLFSGTIRQNILYGNLEATGAQMIDAAMTANIHNFVMELPERYDTMIGERGAKLSGGQRQRIAIARAILKNPRILLLDEATSSLDTESESLVQKALERLMDGRTTVVIAHRLSTIKAAHRIAVLDHGSVTELGTHSELMNLDGLYARLYVMQFRDPPLNSSQPSICEKEEHGRSAVEKPAAVSPALAWARKIALSPTSK